jgi:hypothetical protein
VSSPGGGTLLLNGVCPTTELAGAIRSVIVERVMAHPAGKDPARPHFRPPIAEWLMRNDFQLVVGHTVNFRATPLPHQ